MSSAASARPTHRIPAIPRGAVVLLAVLVLGQASTGLSVAVPAQVQLPFGTVYGNANALGREFLGVPFAAKPQRFKQPQPWTEGYTAGRLDATHYSAQCWQPPTPGDLFNSTVPISEDCLHLNVYTPPAESASRLLPVLVWIHGGGLQYGTAMSAIYNGSRLAAAQSVVVVVINYRLNVLGFQPVTLPDGSISANNGFRDQQMSLQWVQQHICAFGGNHSQVTIFGESAGAQSVAAQVVSPLSAGLFHRAISESGPVSTGRGLSHALNSTLTMAAHISCHDVSNRSALFECLSNADPSAMFNAVMAQNPEAVSVFGDAVLPALPLAMVQRGAFKRVPFILGNNADEVSLMLDGSVRYTAESARCIVDEVVEPEVAASLLGLYPLVGGTDNRQSVVQLISDLLIVCPSRRLATALAAAGAVPWVYEFARRPSCPMYNKSGVFHTTEIPYVFDNLAGVAAMANAADPQCVVAADDLELAAVVSSLWGSFARGEAIAAWPPFDLPKQEIATLDTGATIGRLDTKAGYKRHQCEKLDQLGLTFAHAGALIGAAAKCLPPRASVCTESDGGLPVVGIAGIAVGCAAVAFVATMVTVRLLKKNGAEEHSFEAL